MSLTTLDRPRLTAPHAFGANAAPVADDAHAEAKWATLVIGSFFGLFLGWAAVAPLDAAVYAPGEVTVAGHRQTVQYKETGVIAAIRVKDGQSVKAGDTLVELAGGDIRAQERALSQQVIDLKAQKARLQAEEFDQSSITWPADLLTPAPADQDDVHKAMAIQQNQFLARSRTTQTQRAVLKKKGAELGQQIEGISRQIEATKTQDSLLRDELKGVQSLAAEGYAPQSRVRGLQRDQAQLGGQRGQYVASVAQAREQIVETDLQGAQIERQRAEEVATQLRDTQYQLAELEPRLESARDQVARQTIKAPIDGRVMDLKVTTVGGFVAPGEHLMDVVPDNARLVVEARLQPKDADGLHPGMAVELKFPSIHDRQLRKTKAVLTRLSADTLRDEKTGAPYYMAEATLTPDALRTLQTAESGQFVLKPGLPAQLLISLHKRTALQYMFEPMTDAIWRSFHER